MKKTNNTVTKTKLIKLSQRSKSRIEPRLSVKKLNKLITAASALLNRSGELFTVSEDSKNIFTLKSAQSGNSLIYFKKDARFFNGMVELCAAIDYCNDCYRLLIPVQSVR